jgi:hypothetical protein
VFGEDVNPHTPLIGGRALASAGALLLYSQGMAELRVQVLNDNIIVTLPGSHYSVTYYKPAKSPHWSPSSFRTETTRALQ